MARRRKRNDDWIGIVARLVGVLVLLSFLSPDVRHAVSAFGFLAVCLVGVSVVGLIGFGIYRRVSREKDPNFYESLLSFVDEAIVARENVNLSDGPSALRGTPRTTSEILDQLRSIDWFQFEKIVALVYRKLGYAVTRRGGANPDGGIDLVIENGGQRAAVQCKQWKTWNVGVKAMREFLGALTAAGIKNGIFITLRGYTGDAKQLAEKHGIEIVTETELAMMLESTDARFDPETLALLRDTRKFCPKCESEMVLRTAKKGPDAGSQFWGCSTYPRCRFTMQL